MRNEIIDLVDNAKSGESENQKVEDSADSEIRNTTRPRNFDDFVGQDDIITHLSIMIEAAKTSSRPLDHVLFAGPPGLGKTSLAAIVAREMGVNLSVTSGPALDRPGDLAAILSNLKDNDVLFIDEIHRLSRNIEEVLYPAMEDFQFDIVIGKGPTARSVRIDLPKFTLIGATTRTGSITGPLRDRFGFFGRVQYYSDENLEKIVERVAKIDGIKISLEAASLIAKRGRGTPRIVQRLYRRVRDYCLVKHGGDITSKGVNEASELFGIDESGLDNSDRTYLECLTTTYSGRAVGVSTLAVTLGESNETIEDMIEPYLIINGFIERTARGRIATNKAYLHLDIDPISEKSGTNGEEMTLLEQ
jgi:Holliday junction DNA helicase RuvB